MKHSLFYIIILFITCIFAANKTKANNVAGGELIYIHLADSVYQVVFKLTVDCGGSAAPDSVPLCIKNACNTNVLSMNMGKMSLPNPVPALPLGDLCPNVSTTCTDPNATITGYNPYYYSAIVYIPSPCSSWVFSVSVGNRNNPVNLLNSGNELLYAEAMLNNTITHRNNSAYHAVALPTAVPSGKPNQINLQPLDADGDSLWTYVVMPKAGVTRCNDTAKEMTFNTNTSPPYKIPNNPFQTNNTFSMQGRTGIFGFTAGVTGKVNIALRTDEYRNGVLIGSITRDLQIQLLNSQIVLPNDKRDKSQPSCGNVGPDWTGKIHICPLLDFKYCYAIKAPEYGMRLFITDNLSQLSKGNAKIKYSNQGTDSVYVEFSWTPGLNDVGMHQIIHTVIDSTCNPTPFTFKYALPVDFEVWGKVKAINDTTICNGSPAFLSASGGGVYKWRTLPGGTLNSLTDTTTANPIAYPNKTTTYIVRSTLNDYCSNDIIEDTVTVFVKPSTMGAKVISNSVGCGMPDPGNNYTYLCPGQPYSFCFTSASANNNARLFTSHTTTLPNATVSYNNTGTNNVTAQVTLKPGLYQAGLHSITFKTYDSTCAAPGGEQRMKEQKYDFYIWPPTKTTGDTTICHGQSVELKASGGIQYYWSSPDTTATITTPYNSSITVAPARSTEYIVASTINTICSNNIDTVMVYVKAVPQSPVVTIAVQPSDNIPVGSMAVFTANTTSCTNSSYLWLVNNKPVPGNYSNSFTTGKLSFGDRVSCMLFCSDTCSTDTVSNTITMRTWATGINSIKQDDEVSIFPNPNNGNFTVQFKNYAIHGAAKAEILNMLGQTVHSFTVTAALNDISVKLPAGIYLLQLNTGNDAHTTRFNVE